VTPHRAPYDAEREVRLPATLAAELNETEGFFTDLETFLKERNDYLPYLKFAPEFRQYHDDPRFQDVLSRAGLGG
jgi:hypothetical protein